jgi:outer membrane lipoprotein-sorting protein
MTTTLALLTVSLLGQSPSIMEYVQRDLRDATFQAKVVTAAQRELQKINRDFGQSYRFDTTNIQVKEPLRLRMEAKVADASLLYVINGTDQLTRIPRLGVNQRVNLRDAPGRRQTLLDFGVLTPALFEELFTAKFVRSDRATGHQVFDLTYQSPRDTSRMRIWVDPNRKVVSRREWYGQDGRQKATFLYEEPQQVGGVWFPTRATVRNVENRVAGVMRYENLRVNTGIADSVFTAR